MDLTMAEREGFEPSSEVFRTPKRFSKPVHFRLGNGNIVPGVFTPVFAKDTKHRDFVDNRGRPPE